MWSWVSCVCLIGLVHSCYFLLCFYFYGNCYRYCYRSRWNRTCGLGSHGTDKHRKPVYQQLISSGWNAQTRAVPTTSTDGDTSQMPIMHELDLYIKTMADLRAICNQYNIRTGKAKKDYVENIYFCTNA